MPILAKRQSSLNVEQLSDGRDQRGTARMPNAMRVKNPLEPNSEPVQFKFTAFLLWKEKKNGGESLNLFS